MSDSYSTWTPDRRLANGDISQAIADYEDATGQPPAVIILHPRNERLDDLKEEVCGGNSSCKREQ